jgi:hypothetical protein
MSQVEQPQVDQPQVRQTQVTAVVRVGGRGAIVLTRQYQGDPWATLAPTAPTISLIPNGAVVAKVHDSTKQGIRSIRVHIRANEWGAALAFITALVHVGYELQQQS